MQILWLVQLGVFVSDNFYIGASWKMYNICGSDELFWKPWLWCTREWMNLGMTWLPLFLRIAFLTGLGRQGVIKAPGEHKVENKKKR